MPEKGKRQLAAIMFADMVGYTSLMQEDEEGARLQRDKHRAILTSAVDKHHGEVLQYYGDGTLSIFGSAVEAVQCAVEVQLAVADEPMIPLRIGVHTGDIVHDDEGVYGDGVNLASRIEGLSAPGGVTVSGKVYDEIKNHPSISAVSLGSVQLKNVVDPVSVFAISNKGLNVPNEGAVSPPTTPVHTRRPSPADTVLQRIKDRAVVQWALAYLAGAWALLEIVGFAGSQFLWPSLIPKTIAILVAAGFFITVVVAWYHGEPGRQRISGPELLMIALLLAIAGGAVAVFAPGGGPGLAMEEIGTTAAARERPAIAVLPFENMSADSDEEAAFLAVGLHDDLLTQLSKIASLDVIARTSVMQYAETLKTIPTIGRELGVHTVLEGSVMRAGGQVRLNVQLIDTETDAHLWAETYDREYTVENVFAIQSDLAQQVVRALQAELAPAEQARLEEVPTENLEAYTFFRRGVDALGRPGWEPADLETARAMFSAAVEADPEFALAFASLSSTLCYQFLYYDRAPARLAEAREASDEALRIDPELAEAHSAQAFYHYLRYENDEAMESLARAEASAPGWAAVLTLKSELQIRDWDWDGSLATKERAALLDPRNPEIQLGLAEAYANRDRWDDSDALFARLEETYPDFHEAAFSEGWFPPSSRSRSRSWTSEDSGGRRGNSSRVGPTFSLIRRGPRERWPGRWRSVSLPWNSCPVIPASMPPSADPTPSWDSERKRWKRPVGSGRSCPSPKIQPLAAPYLKRSLTSMPPLAWPRKPPRPWKPSSPYRVSGPYRLCSALISKR
jgi:TolB-like protein/class 3 adenylate cyclase